MEFNGPIDFLNASGQVIAPQGDIVLAPSNETVVSGGQFVPRLNGVQNLGDEARRWGTLHALGGNFTERPTVNEVEVVLDSDIATQDLGVFVAYGNTAETVHALTYQSLKLEHVVSASGIGMNNWTVAPPANVGGQVVTSGAMTYNGAGINQTMLISASLSIRNGNSFARFGWRIRFVKNGDPLSYPGLASQEGPSVLDQGNTADLEHGKSIFLETTVAVSSGDVFGIQLIREGFSNFPVVTDITFIIREL